MIYPEGGRTPDGEIKAFLAGAFFLAIKAQVDIVPVALVGTYELLPMNTYHIKCRPLEMRVGKPISTRDRSKWRSSIVSWLAGRFWKNVVSRTRQWRWSRCTMIRAASSR